jgi:hypothetical protein
LQVTVSDIGSPPAITFDVSLDGATLDAGNTKVVFDNGSIGPHVLVLFKIPDGATEAQLLAALNSGAPPPEGAFEVGAVFAKPGQEHQKQVDLTLEGTYGYFCPIPSPAGVPHFNMGFVGVFEVS